jgi:hypothetical protein
MIRGVNYCGRFPLVHLDFAVHRCWDAATPYSGEVRCRVTIEYTQYNCRYTPLMICFPSGAITCVNLGAGDRGL